MEYSPYFSYGFSSHKRNVGWKQLIWENATYRDEPNIKWWLFDVLDGSTPTETEKEIELRKKFQSIIFDFSQKNLSIQRDVKLVGALKTNLHWILQFRSGLETETIGWGNTRSHREWETITLPHNECPLPDYFGREPTVEELDGFSLRTKIKAASAFRNSKFCLAPFADIRDVSSGNEDYDYETLSKAVTNLKEIFSSIQVPKRYWSDIARSLLVRGRYREDDTIKKEVKELQNHVEKKISVVTQQITNEYLSLYGVYNFLHNLSIASAYGQVNPDDLKFIRDKTSPDLIRTFLGIPNDFAKKNNIEIDGPPNSILIRNLVANYKQFLEQRDKESRSEFWHKWGSKKRVLRTLKHLSQAMENYLDKSDYMAKEDKSPKLPQIPVPDFIIVDGVEFQVHQCKTVNEVKKLGKKFMNCLRQNTYDRRINNYASILKMGDVYGMSQRMTGDGLAVFALLPVKRIYPFKEYGLCIGVSVTEKGPDEMDIGATYLEFELKVPYLSYLEGTGRHTVEQRSQTYIYEFPSYNSGVCTGYQNETPTNPITALAYKTLVDFLVDPPKEIPTTLIAKTETPTEETRNNPYKKSKWKAIDTY